MNKHFILKAALILAPLLVATQVQANNITKSEYKAGKTRISAEYDKDKGACKSLVDNAKDVCIEEAKAKENIARAELEYNYTGKSSDWTKVLEVKAKSAYAVSKEKCDYRTGNEKTLCVDAAKAVETKALADVKMDKEITEARKESVADKMDADYKVALDKCNAMTGNAKVDCVAAAKVKYGKS